MSSVIKGFDPDVLFPPDKYIKLENVPVFDEHESSGAGGKPKKVTKDKLKRIAAKCNDNFEKLGVATPLTLGHSKDDADETAQPPIVGWGVKYSVDPLAKTGKDALFSTWYIKKRFEHCIEDYPFRSIELWESRDELQPVALLRSTPERNLPIIRYSKSTPENSDDVYRYTYSPPNPVSPMEPNMNLDADADDKKMTADAVASESSSSSQLAAEVASLKDQVMQMSQAMQQLMQMIGDEQDGDGEEGADQGGEGEGKDLLESPDAGNDDPNKAEGEDADADAEAPADKKAPEKKAADGEPDQYSANAGPTNSFVPTTEKKTKMSREQEDNELLAKYERRAVKMVADATETLRKENEDLRVQYNRGKAEKMVETLEKDHNIDFGTAEEREEEIGVFAGFLSIDKSGESFKTHSDKVARKYKRKEAAKPDSAGALNVVKFARTPDAGASAFKNADDVTAFVSAYSADPTLTQAAWLAKRAGVVAK